MDAKARLEQVIGAALNDGWQHEAGRLADRVLAEFDLTPKPTATPGPVTSEEAALAFERHHFATPGSRNDLRHALDAAMPLLARDHGYIKLAEVERRARAWVHCRGEQHQAWFGSLLAALTAPEAK